MLYRHIHISVLLNLFLNGGVFRKFVAYRVSRWHLSSSISGPTLTTWLDRQAHLHRVRPDRYDPGGRRVLQLHGHHG